MKSLVATILIALTGIALLLGLPLLGAALAGHDVRQYTHTTGDKITDVALAKVGTKGMFTKEIH